jgi:hypothetical protein
MYLAIRLVVSCVWINIMAGFFLDSLFGFLGGYTKWGKTLQGGGKSSPLLLWVRPRAML